jgi:predicted RNA-binding protein associated with RNAse of E/G family
VKPELGIMEKTGAYVQFGRGEPREPVKEAVASHMKLSRDGYKMFYFFPEDHPLLAHHKQVENQRSLETYVKIYGLINGIAVR